MENILNLNLSKTSIDHKKTWEKPELMTLDVNLTEKVPYSYESGPFGAS